MGEFHIRGRKILFTGSRAECKQNNIAKTVDPTPRQNSHFSFTKVYNLSFGCSDEKENVVET